MRWPWQHQEEKLPETESVMEERDVIDKEKEELKKDLNQVKVVNRNILIRGLAREWLDPDEAEVIRAIQVDGID